jgi:hypothetical protein
VLRFETQVEAYVKIPGSGVVDDPELEAVEAPEDEEAPVALVMVETDGADVCAADGTCW